MNNFLRIYLDFLINIFSFTFLFYYTYSKAQKKPSSKLLFILLCFELLYSIPETIPGIFILTFTLDYLFIFFVNNRKVVNSFIILAKYSVISYISLPAIFIAHSIALQDFRAVIDSDIYCIYKDLLCVATLYIFYALHQNAKKMQLFKTAYIHYFNIIFGIMIIFLSFFSLRTLINTTGPTDPLLWMFSAFYLLILAFLFVYGRLIDILEENALSKIQLEQNAMTAEYGAYVEKNLEMLRRIRHDIKHHLILIDGYASRNECDKIREYIGKISDTLAGAMLIQTSSPALSALLNAKYQEALRLGISCEFTCNINKIFVEDLHLITILGNLLDNAILAASKVADGSVNFTVCQIDTYLEILVVNNHNEQIKEKSGLFSSTKSSKNMVSGIGIKNVRSAVSRLNGQITFSYTKDRFEVTVLLPNYETNVTGSKIITF